MEPVRQHYALATGQGLQSPPPTDPGNFIAKKDAGTAKNPFPNPMMKKGSGK